jgi:RNA polymerase sigma-70 factor, ECF subfamily
MTGRDDLEELLLRVARGDSSGYAELYDRTAPLVYGIARRVVVAPAMAEEVAQEVFSEVWRLAPRFDPDRGAATTWISTMAHRRAVDRVRSEQAHRDRTERVGRRHHEPPYDDVADTVELHLEHDRVRTALAALPQLSREAIEHAFYGGRTYREVAEQLDVPLGTVKSRIRAGLRQLARSLQTTTEGE